MNLFWNNYNNIASYQKTLFFLLHLQDYCYLSFVKCLAYNRSWIYNVFHIDSVYIWLSMLMMMMIINVIDVNISDNNFSLSLYFDLPLFIYRKTTFCINWLAIHFVKFLYCLVIIVYSLAYIVIPSA